ncbi:unnamed protein product [Calypogeia fissa]
MTMNMMDWDDSFARFRKRLGAQHPRPHRHEVPYKVPSFLKEVKPSQYVPQTVSLGLNMRLEPGIESHKTQMFRCFQKWKTDSIPSNREQQALPPVIRQKSERNCLAIDGADSLSLYTWDQLIDDLELDTDVITAPRWYEIDATPVRPVILKSFLTLDALFLTLFLRYSRRKPPLRLPENVQEELEKQTVYRLLAEARSAIWRDVFLLENQIPLHILLKVWHLMPDMECRDRDDASKLFNTLLKEVVKDRYLELFESSSDEGEKFVSKVLLDKNFLKCDHLLDCLHYVVCYSPEDKESVRTADEKGTSPANTIPSATQLLKVGIRLNSDTCNFICRIQFENSFWKGPVLRIPRLFISDPTESLLRNLAAFENVSSNQSLRPRVGPRLSTITSFLLLMDKLIQQEADVQLLREDGIITSSMGDNAEVCKVWKTLCKGLLVSQNSEWADMLKNLNIRYKSRPHQLMAEFKDKYFAKPWMVVSWVVAILFIVMTGLQTFYQILNYYTPPV